MNKLQWNLYRNSNIFIQENAFESVVCETAAIFSRPQCVNKTNMLIMVRHYLLGVSLKVWIHVIFTCIYFSVITTWRKPELTKHMFSNITCMWSLYVICMAIKSSLCKMNCAMLGSNKTTPFSHSAQFEQYNCHLDLSRGKTGLRMSFPVIYTYRADLALQSTWQRLFVWFNRKACLMII